MIPQLVKVPKAPWDVLPPGIHKATLDEVERVFAFNPHRKRLFSGLKQACQALATAGCGRLVLDGSFVTGKPIPSDFDGCWDPDGVIEHLLDPVLLDFSNGRSAQKRKYGGELFVNYGMELASQLPWEEFFQTERHSGGRKGLIEIDLTAETFDRVEGGNS